MKSTFLKIRSPKSLPPRFLFFFQLGRSYLYARENGAGPGSRGVVPDSGSSRELAPDALLTTLTHSFLESLVSAGARGNAKEAPQLLLDKGF